MLYIYPVIPAVEYPYLGRDIRVRFSVPGVCLPVRTRSGGVVLLPWGQREGESGPFPLGCCASLETIQAGEWDYWFPIPVKLPLTRMLELDSHRRCNWSYPLVRGQCVQGLVARDGAERRVYVVTFWCEAEGMQLPRVVVSLGC